MTTTTTDLWHHYGRTRSARDRAVPETFSWVWGQDSGPGAEVLDDLTGLVIGDLGAGAARHAAHLATHHRPARVDAIDSSSAQHAMAIDLYANLPRLRFVHADTVTHLRAEPETYDVLYSVFGSLCFTEPRDMLPAATAALRPHGRLVFSTLAHYLGGDPAEPDVVAADIRATTPNGQTTSMRRWVLQEHVWVKVLDEAGFINIDLDVLPSATDGPRTAATLLVKATRAG